VADGIEALNAMIAMVHAVSKPEDFAPAAAEALRTEIEANVAAQRGPDGEPWPPTASGDAALSGAAGNLQVTPVGSVVVARITGRYAFHHKGQTRGGKARPILPSRKLSGAATKAIKRALVERFGELAKGGG
jgi:hypothetical protein